MQENDKKNAKYFVFGNKIPQKSHLYSKNHVFFALLLMLYILLNISRL